MEGRDDRDDSDMDFTQRSRNNFNARSVSVNSWPQNGKVKRAVVKKKHKEKKNANASKTAGENKKGQRGGAGSERSKLVSTTWKELMDRAILRRDKRLEQSRSGAVHKNAAGADADKSL